MIGFIVIFMLAYYLIPVLAIAILKLIIGF